MTSIFNHNIGIETQIREYAVLGQNSTNYNQERRLAFVQFDDDVAVGSDGCIYQIVGMDDIHEGCTLFYKSETSDTIFNYAEERAEFEDEEDIEIFEHCLSIAQAMMD